MSEFRPPMDTEDTDTVNSGDIVELANAPEPPEDFKNPSKGKVLAIYGSQALVNFWDGGEHYVPKSWLSRVDDNLEELIEDIWSHASATPTGSGVVEVKLYGLTFKVVEDYGGVTVHSNSNMQRIIEDAINYVRNNNE